MESSNESQNSLKDLNANLSETNSLNFLQANWNMSSWQNAFDRAFLKSYDVENMKITNQTNSLSTLPLSKNLLTDGDLSIFLNSIKPFEIDNSQSNKTDDKLLSDSLEKINNCNNSFVNNDLLLEKQKKNKPLNESAIKIMESWYTNNIDFPYPSNTIKKNMALEGKIGVSQVNSWFANRRNRSDNTKPKKNRKQLQVRLYKFAQELEKNSEGRLKAYDIATKINKMIDEYLS